MADLTVKRFDTYPPILAFLADASGPVDLSGASSVKFIMISQAAASLLIGSAPIASAVGGVVQVTPTAAYFSAAVAYNCEFEVLWSTGGVETFPNDGYKTIQVIADLENS